ncbi:MAG: hypothetical protein HQL19_08825, partial [Candidatus Omnitrophica bacterium]|nr:hypothetical protein [Candidatus Omnitrophota bacterium]
FGIDEQNPAFYFKVTAVYNGHENFDSAIQKISLYQPVPSGAVDELQTIQYQLYLNFDQYLKAHDLVTARNMVLKDARQYRDIKAELHGRDLSILYKDQIRAMMQLDDPATLHQKD